MDLVEEYVNASQMQQRDASDVLHEFSGELSRFQGTLLDIACGPGHVTKNMLLPALSNVKTIVAADMSEAMVRYAERHFPDEKITYVVLNIETPEPSDQIEQYDNIVSFSTLHWCYNLSLALQNIYKMLRAGGKALMEFISFHSGFGAYIKLKECPAYKPYLQDAHRYVPYFQRIGDIEHPERTLKTMLQDIGFTILHVSKREKSYKYSRQSLKNHARAVNPFIKRIPIQMKNDFIDELVNEILKQTTVVDKREINENEDTLQLSYCLLIAYVQKPTASETVKIK